MNPIINPISRGVFTDLDGTLLNANQRLSPCNEKALENLGEDNILRVVVTGRSLLSARRVLNRQFPIDLLVTASGAGIFRFPSEELLFSAFMARSAVIRCVKLLRKLSVDFMVHEPLPNNHLFAWHSSGRPNPDFYRRLELYSNYHLQLPEDIDELTSATQLLIVCPKEDKGQMQESQQKSLPNLSIIRTTSPLDHSSIWYEIFPRNISKANAAVWVCEHFNIDQRTALTIGNDFNDIDLLQWGHCSRVVANAPIELRSRFGVVADHNEDGFAEAVTEWRQTI